MTFQLSPISKIKKSFLFLDKSFLYVVIAKILFHPGDVHGISNFCTLSLLKLIESSDDNVNSEDEHYAKIKTYKK